MLARNKCLKVFPVLKSVHFPPRSLHLLVGRGQLPLSQCMIVEVLRWNKKIFYHDTEALTGGSAVSPSSTYSREKGSATLRSVCMQRAPATSVQTRGSDWAKLARHVERQQIGVMALSVPPSPRVNLGRDISTNRTLHSVRYTEGVDSVRKHTLGVRGETRLWSLHLTRDMLDVNLGLTCIYIFCWSTFLKVLYGLTIHNCSCLGEYHLDRKQRFTLFLGDYFWIISNLKYTSTWTLWRTTNQSVSIIRRDKHHPRYSLQASISGPPIFASFRPRWHEALKAP